MARCNDLFYPVSFRSADGLSIACARCNGRQHVRGVVQIAHGMGEHIGRCLGLIDALASGGFTVYGNDHHGHGRTAPSPAHLGDFGDEKQLYSKPLF